MLFYFSHAGCLLLGGLIVAAMSDNAQDTIDGIRKRGWRNLKKMVMGWFS